MFLDYVKDNDNDFKFTISNNNDLFNDIDDTISVHSERFHKIIHTAFSSIKNGLKELNDNNKFSDNNNHQ